MGEVGADAACGAGAADGMASVAAVLRKQAGAVALGRGRAALVGKPGVERRRLHRDDIERHQRVAEAAEFGALAAVAPGLVGAHDERVGAAGNHVHLAGEAGDPEAVDDVRRGQAEGDGATDGDADFVGGLDRCGTGGTIGDAPPELLAIDRDLQIGGRDGAGAHEGERVDEQAEQQNCGDDAAEPQDEAHAAAQAQLAFGRAHRMAHQQCERAGDHDRAGEHQQEQVADVGGVGAERRERRLMRVAACQQDAAAGNDEAPDPPHRCRTLRGRNGSSSIV